jgi:ferredoxin-NADP reductase
VRPVLLIHAANRPERMLFRDEIEALRGAVNLRCVPVFEAPPPGWSGESGFVTRELLARHLPAQYLRHQFFVCGPPPMMDLVEGALLALGVPPDRIGTERFDLI